MITIKVLMRQVDLRSEHLSSKVIDSQVNSKVSKNVRDLHELLYYTFACYGYILYEQGNS